MNPIDRSIETYRRGNILLLNWLFYIIVFLVLVLYKSFCCSIQNIIYWPGADILVFGMLTPLVFRIHRTYSISSKKGWVFLLIIFIGLIHFLIKGLVILFLERLFLIEEHFTFYILINYWLENWFMFMQYSFWYLLIILAFISISGYLRFLDLQKEKSKLLSELDKAATENLNSRLNPHFLFNAMNNISMMVRKNENTRANEMIAALSGLMRRAMDNKVELVRLKDEVAFLKEYIKLELLRYDDQVDINITIPEEYDELKVPQLLLQPIVENAFKYGIHSNGQLQISIEARKEQDDLVFNIYNSGSGIDNWDLNNPRGIGLHHTIHRLRQYYGDKFNFKIKEDDQGIRFIITIPYE